MNLENKIGVITGGTTGIGLESAKSFFKAGAKALIITGQNKERLDAAAEELSLLGEVTGVIWRGEEFADSAALAQVIKDQHGHLDFAFLNAGVCWATPLGSLNPQELQQQLAINLVSPLVLVNEIAPLMVDGGSVVLTTSCLNQVGVPGYAAYAASKAGLRSLARTLSAELKDKKIRVNSIAPGPIETPIHSKYGIAGDELDEAKKQVASMVPLGRFGTTDEVVDAVVFLASSSSSYMLGEEIVIDGGWAHL